MPLTNKYLRYSPEITLEIFTLVWDKLIKTGLKGSHSESVAKKYSNFKSLYSYLELSSDLSCFECYEECSEKLETTVQEILGYNPFVKDDFVLPEKWCIKTPRFSNAPKEIISWRVDTLQKGNWCNSGYLSNTGYHYDEIKPDYTEITFDQFKKYVLKEDFDWDLYETKSQPKQPLKQAVHCKTQEEWDFVLTKENKYGLQNNTFSIYKNETCLAIGGNYQDFNYFQMGGFQILSFQEWCGLNGYKMKSKCDFIVGNWYKINDCWYLKYKRKDIVDTNKIYISECIDSTFNHKYDNDFIVYLREQKTWCLASIEEIQQYLPDNHPDKITPAIQQVRDMQSGFKVGNWVIVLKESPGRNGKLNQLYKITGIYGNHITYSPRENIDIDKVKVRHATPEEINNHLISIRKIPAGEPLDTGIEPNKDGIFKYTTYSETTHVGKTSTISGPLKMILSIDDEELPMVNIIKTNSIKQLLNND